MTPYEWIGYGGMALALILSIFTFMVSRHIRVLSERHKKGNSPNNLSQPTHLSKKALDA